LHWSKPNRKKSVILAGILGIGIGVFISFLKEYILNQDRNRDEKWLELKQIFRSNLLDLFSKNAFFKKGKTS